MHATLTPTPLCELAQKHGTDKYPWYTPFYDALLRGRQVKTVLEIGVLDGASLRMWFEYFPDALVYGLDLFNTTELDVIIGDQSRPRDLAFVARHGPFDLIVDDGSHKPEDQVLGALTLLPHLREGGLYIIEDVNPPSSSVVDKLPFPCQYVECRVPGSDKVGRCVVIES